MDVSSLHLLREEAKKRRPAKPGAYIPVSLHPQQRVFFEDDRLEILYGGAAGGGKSVAQLASALKYAHVPGYSAVLFRRSYSHLTMPGGLIPVSREWLGGRASWNQATHTWEFPSGAVLAFGYLDHDRHLDRYQGAEFHYVGFDEATQFPEHHYRYLFSRLRRTHDVHVPLRFRATANPGGVGHEFIKRRFLTEGPKHGRRFIPALLDDNPSLDRDSYLKSLQELDPLTRQRLLNGDWDAVPTGGFFHREWWRIESPSAVPQGARFVRYWDPAATEAEAGKDPDWTAGAKVALHRGVWYVRDVRRFRASPEGTERRVLEAARADGGTIPIFMEQEPGSSGKSVISHYARNVLPGYTFRGHRTTGSKVIRAGPLASAAENGNVVLIEGDWIGAFIDEADAFPLGTHDDAVDAVSGAMAVINDRARKVRTIKVRNL